MSYQENRYILNQNKNQQNLLYQLQISMSNKQKFDKDNKPGKSTLNFFSDLIQHPRNTEGQLIQPYFTNRSAKSTKDHKALGVVTDLLLGIEDNSALDFQKTFVYGVEMQMWRKEKIKNIMVFIDQNLPNLIWFSSQTKAFLVDLTYAEIDRCDFQLEKMSGVKHYIILRYFQEEIPLLFKDSEEMEKYFHLFNNYIKYNKFRQYPPFFSRIMKLYTIEQVKCNISRQKYADDILNISQVVCDIDMQECKSILKSVYLEARKQALRYQSELKSNEIRDYFKILHCSKDLIGIFEKYSQKKLSSRLEYLQKTISKHQFINFLQVEQKMTLENAENLGDYMKEEINFYEFCTFLENQKLNHAAEAIQINEDLPLTDYFCYSSHNTYLSGNQLTSDSKIERYLQDLQRGLKCVQIDIHNDGNTPIINHALGDRSFCAPIDFEETIKEISKFCDSNTRHYPLILSIENHAKEQNRYKVANIMLKYLSNRIFFISEAYQYEDPIYFKTLKELRGKVIVKTDSKLAEVMSFKKKTTFALKQNALKLYSPEPKFPRQSFQQSYNKFQQMIKTLIRRKEDFDLSIPNSLFLPISEMAKVTGLFKSEKGIENQNSVGCECTSLTNEKAMKCSQEKIIEYSKRSFLRIYPVGTEISSSNYDPVPHLKIGAQIIALNTQTKDEYAWLIMSYFKAGRQDNLENIGYIPKPDHLRTNKKKQNCKKIINIDIISTIKSVYIQFYGSSRDMKANSKRKGNIFEVIDYDEAFLMFTINEDLKECVPIRFIRQGFRVLVAKNKLFKDSGIRVIIHIDIVIEKI